MRINLFSPAASPKWGAFHAGEHEVGTELGQIHPDFAKLLLDAEPAVAEEVDPSEKKKASKK